MREGVFLAPKRAKRKEARGLVPLVARVLSAGLSLLVASAAIRASAGLDDPAPQGEPPVEEATEEVQSREQRMLRQAVFRDRTIQCALDEAESALRIGEINRAVAEEKLLGQGDIYVVGRGQPQAFQQARCITGDPRSRIRKSRSFVIAAAGAVPRSSRKVCRKWATRMCVRSPGDSAPGRKPRCRRPLNHPRPDNALTRVST